MRQTRRIDTIRAFCILMVVCLGFFMPSLTMAASLEWVSEWGASGVPDNLSMYIYVPDNVAANPPILVLLHYWGGGASGVFGQAVAGGIVDASDQYGFIIVVPETDLDTQPCWDYSSAQTLTRNGGGQTQGIAQMVQYTIDTYSANADRVYVTGDSCGGMMTEAMLAVYPDMFKAGVDFCGVPAGGAWTPVTHTTQEWGDIVRNINPGYPGPWPRIQLWHGTADELVDYANMSEAIMQWTNVQGLSLAPTDTATLTMNGSEWTHETWLGPCGNTLVEAWSETDGTHSIGSLFDAQYVIPFLGLDIVGPDDPGLVCDPRSAFSQIEAETYSLQSGIQIEQCAEGGQDVGFIENGDYLVYRSIDFDTGAVSFDARIASAGTGGNIELYLDSLTGTQIGTCTVPVTGDWQSWTTVSCPVSGATGQHDVYLKFTGGDSYLFNLNWFKFNTTTGIDIGSVGMAGGANYGSNVYTVNGAGADIGGTSDAFHFVSVPATGDCSITVRVSSLQNTDPWAKAGVMIRESMDSDAANAFVGLTPENGVHMQFRSITGGTTNLSGVPGPAEPCWLKLVRASDTFTGFYSTNGVTWTQLVSTTITMGPAAYIGLAVTSHDSSALCTAIFDSMTAPHWPTSAAPAGVIAAPLSSTEIGVIWNAASNMDTYAIKRSTTSGGPYTLLAGNITATGYNDTDILPETPYYYVVSGVVGGAETPNSAEVTATSQNMHAHLLFNESDSTTASDSSGNGWDGTLVNGPVWASGKFDGAVGLDGTDDHVALPAGVVDGLTEVTISTWVYLNSANTWARLFDFGTGTNNYMYITTKNIMGHVQFGILSNGYGEQQIRSDTELSIHEWTHLSVTMDGSTSILYLNGEEVGRNEYASYTPDSLGATTQNYIGRSQWPDDPYLEGCVDDFRIYASAWSGQEVMELYKVQTHVIPDVPTGLSASKIPYNRIDLTWDHSHGATSYTIKRAETDGGPYIPVATVEATSYSDMNLSEKTTYYYVITAANNAGESSISSQADATTLPIPPAIVTGLTATSGDNSVELSWDLNDAGDIAGYNVYRSTTSGSGYTLLNGFLLSNPEYTDDTAANFTTYYYVVTAVDLDTLESAYSDEVEAMPNDGTFLRLSGTDFESGFGDWVNITGDDTHDWTLDRLGTLTPSTGPAAGANGSTWYVYLETSPGGASAAGDTTILESPVLGGFGRLLTFDYHMYGVEIGTLSVDVYDGVWHTDVWSISGQQQISTTDEYITASVDLAEYGGPIQVRLRATAAGGPRGDMAIDNIDVAGRIFYGDMNGDKIINQNDLPDFIGNWLSANETLDINRDGVVGLYEFAEFARSWLDDSFQ